MNQYEITYISDPQLTDEARQELDATIETKVTEFSGAIEKNEPNSRRRLIYPIHKKVSGFLRTINIQLDPERLAEVHHYLKREGNILRFTIVNCAPRGVVSQEIVDRHTPQRKGVTNNKDKRKPEKMMVPKPVKSTKEVTMEDVEKGIEEALSEEVK